MSFLSTDIVGGVTLGEEILPVGDNGLRSSTAPSTPVSSHQDIQSDDRMDLNSDSELSSLHTTPDCSPLLKSTTSGSDVDDLVLNSQRIEKLDGMAQGNSSGDMMNVGHVTPSATLIPGESSLVLKLVFAHISRLESILSSNPKPEVQASTANISRRSSRRNATSIGPPFVFTGETSIQTAEKTSQDAPEQNFVSGSSNSSTPSKQGNKKRSRPDLEDADFDDIDIKDVDSDHAAEQLSPPPKKRARQTKAQPKTPRQKLSNNIGSGSKATRAKASPAKKYWQSAQEGFPEPYGSPPAWAKTRQALCETLPYYRAYQSGPYHHDGRVYGLLIDKEGSSRDIFNEEVIITRVGGGKKFDEETKSMVQKDDRDSSPTHIAFQRTREAHTPVAVIAGQGNKLSPCKMPHYYNVLAWFHVTDVWSEKISTGVKVPMVRLEKIDLKSKSWWAAADTPLPNPERDLNAFTTTSGTCVTCKKASQEIFQQGWTCLHTTCSQYFHFNIPASVSHFEFYDGLVYNLNFIEKRSQYQGIISQPLVPVLPLMDSIGTDFFGCESHFGKGVVCPKCFSCSRRTKWEGWSCENLSCDWSQPAQRSIASVAEVMAEVMPKKEKVGPMIRTSCMPLGAYDVQEYIIPGEAAGSQAGFVRHFRANDVINGQPHGPNDLFREMQENDFGLQRKPCRQPGATGEMLTNHYLMNWGAPYKFIAPVDSKGFNQAPPQILKALMRMTWAGNQAVTANQEAFVPFNELLSVGYFEDGAMGYHDDGESTLGPTVSSLSLGSSSTMSFRPKKKSSIGISGNKRGDKPAMLSITLNHGDMIVMHGADIQKLYEHEVVPHGKLRFVLTCRHIVPEKIPEAADRARSLLDGAMPNNINQYDYDGDANPLPIPPQATNNTHLTDEATHIEKLKALIRNRNLSEQGKIDLKKLVQELDEQSTSGS